MSIDVKYFVFQEAAKSYLYDSLWSVSLYKALGDPARNRKSDLPRILRWGELTIRKRKEQFGRAGDENEKGQSLFLWTCTLSSSKKVAERRDTLYVGAVVFDICGLVCFWC